MRRGQLPAGCAGMFAQLQRTRTGAGINIVEVEDLFALPLLFYKFQRDVVILVAGQSRAQTFDLHWEGKPHLDPRVETFQIGLIVIQGGFDHLEAEGGFSMAVEAAHDTGHVNALLLGIKRD